MKLWKILLAAMIAVLMISVVAMAEGPACSNPAGHNYQKLDDTRATSNFTSYKVGDEYWHHYMISWKTRCSYCHHESTISEWADRQCSPDWGTPIPVTCNKPGYIPGNCIYCGADMIDQWQPADPTKHDYIKGPWIEATCQVARHYVGVCSACGHTKTFWDNDDSTARESHGWENNVKIADATCQSPAKFATVCKWCKVVKDGTTITGTKYGDHDMKWTTVVEPSCDKDGLKSGVCNRCGHKENLVIAGAAGHVALPATIETVVKATCTTDGYKTATCYLCNETFKIKIDKLGHAKHEHKATEATCGKPGNYTYYTCDNGCGTMWDYTKEWVITSVPVKPANGQHILSHKDTVNVKDCTSSANYAEGKCEVCGEYARVYIPAREHEFASVADCIKAGHTGKAWCDVSDTVEVKCHNCPEVKTLTIPALGHNYAAWRYGNAATCTTDLVAYSNCSRCGNETSKVIEEALGHNWILQEGSKDATCTEAGKGTRFCTRCKNTQQNVTIPAKGHNFSKVVETVKPTCDAQGYTVYGCANGCGETQKGSYTAALGHNYQWEVVVKPSEAGNGKNEYTCQVCGKVADTKTVKYTKYYYNNTMTSFGPTTKELVGGNDWYRVTPVDVTVDGVYTYDLIASNKYVVGTVTISVNAGTLTVSYKVKGNVDVKDESLLIYASKADLAAGSAVTAPVGAAINVAETFGADGKVLVSLILTGDYDAAGKDLVNDAAAAGMIANID